MNRTSPAGAGNNQFFIVSLARLEENPEDPIVRAREIADGSPALVADARVAAWPRLRRWPN